MISARQPAQCGALVFVIARRVQLAEAKQY